MFFIFIFFLSMNHWASGDFGPGMHSSFPPTVEMRRILDGPVSEEEAVNVTLHCDLDEGNPLELTTVYWFMNGEFIRQLPDPHCDPIDDLEVEDHSDDSGKFELGYDYSEMEFLCNVDPSKLFLQHVTREFSGNFSCSGSNIAGEGHHSETVELNVLYLPGQAVISQEEENASKGVSVTFLCSVEDQGNPAAEEYIWKRGSEYLGISSRKLILTNLTTADSGANISCAAASDLGTGNMGYVQLNIQGWVQGENGKYCSSACLAPPAFVLTQPETPNKHDEIVAKVINDALQKPDCSISYAIEEEEIVLLCSAEANTKDVKFWWEKNKITFDGQTGEETLESEVRIKSMTDSAGTYLCHVKNSFGQRQSCMIDLTEAMMTKGLSEEIILIIIAVFAVIILLIIIIIIACFCCQDNTDKEERDKMRGKRNNVPLLNNEQDSIASSFYENLPFEWLQIPPKQTVASPSPDRMDYADDDYLDTNEHGPIKYKQTSEKNATIRRQKIEERKSILL